MASLTAGLSHSLNNSSTLYRNHQLLHPSNSPSSFFFPIPSPSFQYTPLSNRTQPISCLPTKNNIYSIDDNEEEVEEQREDTLLYSVSPLPLLFLAALPGGGTIRSAFAPFVEIVKSLNLPGWLVHWGHPGNMAVVLFAMGGYGTYLGFRIRFSDDVVIIMPTKHLCLRCV
ncbi:hypothetical protein LINGRAHAP2_LOCUS35612 [Linum grandiflorum]